jgi:hypothetical protein
VVQPLAVGQRHGSKGLAVDLLQTLEKLGFQSFEELKFI